MEEIVFDAMAGDEVTQCKIYKPSGATDHWQLQMGGYYYGAIINYQGKWTCYGTGMDKLTTDDKDAIVERIIAYESGKQ